MLEIKDFEVMGIPMAIRGMRNPLNSWDKSDSKFCYYSCLTMDDSPGENACNNMCCMTMGGIPGENVCDNLCADKLFRGYLQMGDG